MLNKTFALIGGLQLITDDTQCVSFNAALSTTAVMGSLVSLSCHAQCSK